MKHLKINDSIIDLKVKNCRQCPCYHDGAGWEYPSRCMLTGEDGEELYDEDIIDSEFILEDCPLPDWCDNEKTKRL